MIMKPWDIKTTGNKPTDDFLVPLWAQFRPKDFYFASQWMDDVGSTLIYIVPSEYFDKFGNMYEDSMPIVHYLPEYLEEILPCVYEAEDIMMYRVEQELKSYGFNHNRWFQKFIDEQGENFDL